MNNPNIEAYPGLILSGENNFNKKGKTPHKIVYLSSSELGPEYFEGAMLTSSVNSKFNILIIPEHFFLKTNANGENYKFPTKPTCVRPRIHIKKNVWAPFHIEGELTEDGLEFVIKAVGTFNENNID